MGMGMNMKHRSSRRYSRRQRKPRNMQPVGWAIIIFMVISVWLRMVATNPKLMELFK